MPIEPFLEKLEDVDESLRPLYIETEGGFMLDTDVQNHPGTRGLKNAYIQEQEKRKKARQELDKFKDVDLERWTALAELSPAEIESFRVWQERKDDSNKPQNPEDFEARLEKATAKLRADHKKEIDARDVRLHEVETEREQLTLDLRKFRINQALVSAAAKKGARNPKDILLRAESVWRMDENGEPAAFDEAGDVIRGHDSIKPQTMDEWIESVAKESPYLFKESSGGGLKGSVNGGRGQIQSRAELKTIDQKVAFIREHGQEAFEELSD